MKTTASHERECFICGAVNNLHKHHVYGASNRGKSERLGMWCYLCVNHHVGPQGVHQNRELDLYLKRLYQKAFEQEYSREEFRRVFGKSYL